MSDEAMGKGTHIPVAMTTQYVLLTTPLASQGSIPVASIRSVEEKTNERQANVKTYNNSISTILTFKPMMSISNTYCAIDFLKPRFTVINWPNLMIPNVRTPSAMAVTDTKHTILYLAARHLSIGVLLPFQTMNHGLATAEA